MDIDFLIHGLPNFAENQNLNPQHEEVDSSAFSATPENAVVPRFGGQTGEEINAQARANLDKMKKGEWQLDASPKYITKPKSMKEALTLSSTGDKNSKAQQAIDEIYSEFEVNPMNPSQMYTGFETDDGEDVVVLLELKAFDGAVHVSWIQSIPEGKGAGSEVMNLIKQTAEKYDVPVTLAPWSKGKKALLNKFYQKHGFQKRNPDSDTMIYRK